MSDTIMRCGLIGLGVTLLEEVCHWGWALRFQVLKPDPVSLSLPAAYSVQILNAQLYLQDHVCICASILPAITIMDYTSQL